MEDRSFMRNPTRSLHFVLRDTACDKNHNAFSKREWAKIREREQI